MKKALLFIILLLPVFAHAQVTRKVIAEHFTNTYCSVCAARNPGFYGNLWHYPEVLHIAYYPSAPYAACPLSQHNTPEADVRTNFYGIYGATPRLVIQGGVVPSSAAYNDTTLFSSQLGQLSSFALKVEITAASATTGTVRVVVKKVAASSLITLNLYGAIVEDTLFFTANNGETKHYDVFRKAVWSAAPESITAPIAVGDSVVRTQTISFNSAWNISRIYAIAMLQDAGKVMIQAERSGHISSSLQVRTISNNVTVFPSPAKNKLFINGLPMGNYQYRITDITGNVVADEIFSGSINVSALNSGMYMLHLYNGNTRFVTKFVKE